MPRWTNEACGAFMGTGPWSVNGFRRVTLGLGPVCGKGRRAVCPADLQQFGAIDLAGLLVGQGRRSGHWQLMQSGLSFGGGRGHAFARFAGLVVLDLASTRRSSNGLETASDQSTAAWAPIHGVSEG